MNTQPTASTGALLLFGLLVLPGCRPSQEQQAFDAHNRGVAHTEKGESDKAIADYAEAIRLNPEYAEAYYNRGLVYGRDKGQFDNAFTDFTEAIRLNPEFSNA